MITTRLTLECYSVATIEEPDRLPGTLPWDGVDTDTRYNVCPLCGGLKGKRARCCKECYGRLQQKPQWLQEKFKFFLDALLMGDLGARVWEAEGGG